MNELTLAPDAQTCTISILELNRVNEDKDVTP